jgi:DNA invertase Pin-like site-specific DNA recombinase
MLIGYMRVSTTEQNTDLQHDALIAAGVDSQHIYKDVMSGKRDDRAGLAACLKALRSGDTIVVWRLDRLGRSLKHLVTTISDLGERNIGFRVLTGAPIDTTTAAGKLIFGIFASLAEFERELIRERVNAGLVAAKSRGRVGGRPKADEKKLRVAEKLMAAGDSMKEAARVSGISISTLKRREMGKKSSKQVPEDVLS